MARLDFRTRHGAWHVVGWREPVMAAAAELAIADFEGAGSGGEFVDLAASRAYFKRGRLRGKTRWRYALRVHLLRRRPPRVQEYFNLCWLTERLFQTPLPLAAGVLLVRGLPTYQFLLTERVPDARTLGEFLDDATPDERAPVVGELAREVARMHALGFVHHDLFPRNLLVTGPSIERRVHFLDAWAGGPSPQWRSDAYDLACLGLGLEELGRRELFRGFLEAYAKERAAQGRPVQAARFQAAIERRWRALESRARAITAP